MACHHADLDKRRGFAEPGQVQKCTDCSSQGVDLWNCMYKDCSYVGCTANDNNHGFYHYDENPTHCVHICLSNKNIRCYECGNESLGLASAPEPSYNYNSQMGSFGALAGGLKGAGDKSHTMNVLGLERGPGLNVSGAGDSQDSSDADDEDSLENNFDGKPRGLVGLQNIGNTCYMNSAIQALSNTPPLTQYFLDCTAAVDFLSDNKQPGLSRSFQKLVREIWNKKTRGYVVPNGILYGIRNVHPMFRGYHQHDTQEFLRCFMDQLHEELKEPVREDKIQRNKQVKLGYIDRQPLQKNSYSQSNDIGPSLDCSRIQYPNCNEGNEWLRGSSYMQKSSARSYDNISSATKRIYSHSENDTGYFFPRYHRSASYCDTRGYSQVPQDIKNTTESLNTSPRPCSPMDMNDHESSEKEFEDEDEETYETCDSGGSDIGSLSGEESFTAKANGGFKRNRSEMESVDNHEGGDGASEKPVTKFRSVISDVFDGRLLSSVQCLTCDRVSTRIETFQDLSLPIPSKDHVAVLHNGSSPPVNGNGVNSGSSSGSGRNAVCSDAVYSATSSQEGWVWWLLGWLRSWIYGPAVTLHDCLAAFFSADELKGDNMYSCEKCNKLRNGVKYSKVLSLPEVLCVHLKRFRHELMSSTKIGAKVSFPLTGLDMRPYLHKDCTSTVSTYDLVAVICHAGTAGGGHYTCVARNRHAGRWFEFDDQCVTGLNPEQVAACEAYVLFYKKTNPRMVTLRQRVIELIESSYELNDIKFYVSKQWINRFNTYAEPGPIDNHDFLCPHGGVSPDRAPIVEKLTTVVSQQLWEFLYENFGGGPACNHLHSCVVCRLEIEKLHRRQKMEFQRFTTLRQYFLQEQEAVSSIYAISMNWFRLWQAFVHNKTQQPPPPIDNSTIIKNPQDNKSNMPIVKPDSDFAQLNEELWRFFLEIYGGGPEVKLKSVPAVQAEPLPSKSLSNNSEQSNTLQSKKEVIVTKEPEEKREDNHHVKSLSNTDLFNILFKHEAAKNSSVKTTQSLQDVSIKTHQISESCVKSSPVTKDRRAVKTEEPSEEVPITNGLEVDYRNGQVTTKIKDISSDDSEYQINRNKFKKGGGRRSRRTSEKMKSSLSADNSVVESLQDNLLDDQHDKFQNSMKPDNSKATLGKVKSSQDLSSEVYEESNSKVESTPKESKRANRKSRKSQQHSAHKRGNGIAHQQTESPPMVNGGEKVAK